VRVGRVASLVDVAPTVLDFLGLPTLHVYQGCSLLDGPSGMALFCTDYALGFLGLRDGRWKLIHQLDSGWSQLFDLHADPEERHDRSAAFLERVEIYRTRLLHWGAAQKYHVTRRR
jgi:arylsulfatase A-like enzyme